MSREAETAAAREAARRVRAHARSGIGDAAVVCRARKARRGVHTVGACATYVVQAVVGREGGDRGVVQVEVHTREQTVSALCAEDGHCAAALVCVSDTLSVCERHTASSATTGTHCAQTMGVR